MELFLELKNKLTKHKVLLLIEIILFFGLTYQLWFQLLLVCYWYTRQKFVSIIMYFISP